MKRKEKEKEKAQEGLFVPLQMSGDTSTNTRRARTTSGLLWSPEDILDELQGLSTPKELSGCKLLLEVGGGVDRGWIMDFTAQEAAISRYDIPGFDDLKSKSKSKSKKKNPSGPPPLLKELKDLPWVWYKDEKVFSKIESGKMSDMSAFVMGKLAMAGDSSLWDHLEGIWNEAKEKVKERKRRLQMHGGGAGAGETGVLDEKGEDDNDEDDDDDDEVDEVARIIAMFKPEVEPTDPRTRAFWKRHLGTDMLVGSYLYLISSIFYMGLCYQSLSKSLSNPDASSDPSSVAHAIANLVAAVMFALASVYFIQLSYPEITMIMVYRAMTKDPDTMSFMERYFTANEMLIALWMITGAFVLPLFLVVIFEVAVLHELKHAFIDFLKMFVAIPLSGVLNVSVMPDAMRANNGRGSSYFFDGFLAPVLGLKRDNSNKDRIAFWTKHLGSDMLAGVWTFAILGVLGGVGIVPMVIMNPQSTKMWLMFWSTLPFSVGALLMLRGSYPETMNSSLIFSDDESAMEMTKSEETGEETPLLLSS